MTSRFLKYRLRTLLLLVAGAAVALGVWRRASEHRATVAALGKAAYVAPPIKNPGWLDRITHADLKRVKNVSFHGVWKVSGADLAALRRCFRLRRLSLHRTSVTDKEMVHLSPFKQLRTLSLKFTSVTDAGLVHLSGLHDLELLQLSSTKVQGGGLKHLRELPHLQTLEMYNLPLVDEDLQILETFGDLRTLEFSSNALQDIRIAGWPKLANLSVRCWLLNDGRLLLQQLARLEGIVVVLGRPGGSGLGRSN